jgi:uncharacterized protein (DUF169 family)
VQKSQWRGFALRLEEVFGLELVPVAVKVKDKTSPPAPEKVRICRAILDAAKGKAVSVCSSNNACFGAAWHLGFHKIKDPKVRALTRQFVVEGEKLFSSYEALDTLMSQMEDVPNNSSSCFCLSPLKEMDEEPDLVIFVVNPEEACRLLTLVTFGDGLMPKIKIGGPTCRMAIMYPLLADEVNVSFYDYTARKLCNMEKDKLLVSIPYKRISGIVADLDKCTAGTAKIEYPAEFREFLRKRLAR